MILITPGTWIVPVDIIDHTSFRAHNVEDKPHLCSELDLIQNAFPNRRVRCVLCGNVELYLKVHEYPRLYFCPTHWRPVLKPKVDFVASLLAPMDEHVS